jgi:hypothetical protein
MRQILAEGGGPSARDGVASAEAYAEFCRVANARLRSCTEHLKKGMVSEALRIAETEPVLLDFCGELDFVGIEKWGKLCAQRGWPSAEPIDGMAIHALNEAYASGQALSPLLQEYRRAVRQGQTKECVRLLRRIAQLDNANPNWGQDLRGFENRRLDEIKREHEAAKVGADAEKLAALVVEINGEWSSPLDRAIGDEIRASARGVYEKLALESGRRLLADVAQSYAALDYDRLASSVASYKALMHEGYLVPDASMSTQFDEANEWLEQETKRRLEDQRYDEAIGRLRNAVEKGDGRNLDEVLNLLSRFDRPIPDRLEERGRALIDANRLIRERRRKRHMVLAAILLMMLGAGVATLIARQRYDSAVQHLRSALAAAYADEDADGVRALLSKAEREAPRVFSAAEIQVLANGLTELESRLQRKQAAFTQAMSRLEAARAEGFVDEAGEIEALVAEARSNATKGAPQGQLAVMVREWEAHKSALRADSERRDASLIEEFSSGLESLKRQLGNGGSASKSQFDTLREKGLTIQESLDAASPEHKAKIATLLATLEQLASEPESKRLQLSRIGGAETIQGYLDGMKTYARAFPADGLIKTWSEAMGRGPSYLQLMEGPYACSTNNAYWFVASQLRGRRTATAEAMWPEIKSKLLDLDIEKRFTELYEAKSADWTIFFEGKPERQVIDGVLRCEGKAYKLSPQDTQPVFSEQVVSAGGMSALLMPHCDYVKGLVSMARFSDATRAFDDILGKMRDLYATNGVPPLLKLRLMGMLVDCETELVGVEALPGWRSLARDLRSIDPDLHWLCRQHPDVQRANAEAEAILRRHFGSSMFINQSRFLNEVIDVSLNRSIQWVGYADLTNSSRVVWRSGSGPAEVWVLRPTEVSATPKIMLAAEMGPNGYTSYKKYLAGEPLFAPSDGRTTRSILEALKKKHGIANSAELEWPASWPVNFHQ